MVKDYRNGFYLKDAETQEDLENDGMNIRLWNRLACLYHEAKKHRHAVH
jgi:hypothetical protein